MDDAGGVEPEYGPDLRQTDRAELLEEIRTAEEQVARGEGIDHLEARRQVLARFPRQG